MTGERFDLVTARLNRGLSLRGAALAIGIARDTYERVERGESVHPATAKKIADFYGVTVVDILPPEAVSA